MHINSQTRVILVSSIENMLLGLIRTADMLSLSLGDSRIFFVWEMKFPYKKIFHTQKKCGEILSYPILSYPIIYKSMEQRIITAPMTAR